MAQSKKQEKNQIKHIAIIMDGNGRWAKEKGLSRIEGHKAGARTVERVLKAAEKYNIEYLTLYAFSTENWKRPKMEIAGLMNLLKEFLEVNLKALHEKETRLRTIGRTNDLPFLTRKVLEKAIKDTSKYSKRQLILALSYGGRAEIIDAVKKLAEDVKSNKVKPDFINEEVFSNYLYAPDIPDPELMIRTSGEMRLSNFLLWQLSYSELWITNTLWPDFGEEEFSEAINHYYLRNRRYGGV
ncbi:MAG: isoprenyl transferase [Lentisphaerota bacterium]